MTAKEPVNLFYQPLGPLRCEVSSDALWEYASLRALEVARMLRNEHPMYVGELNPDRRKWNDVVNELESKR